MSETAGGGRGAGLVRVLLVCPNPRDMATLDLAEEQRKILESIALAEQRDRVSITPLPAATVRDLPRALLGTTQ